MSLWGVFNVFEEMQPDMLSKRNIFSSLSVFPLLHIVKKKSVSWKKKKKWVHVINAISKSEVYSLLLKKQNYMENYARWAWIY